MMMMMIEFVHVFTISKHMFTTRVCIFRYPFVDPLETHYFGYYQKYNEFVMKRKVCLQKLSNNVFLISSGHKSFVCVSR